MKPLRLWQTKGFRSWIGALDARTRSRIYRRLDRACELGHFGDHAGVGGNVSEMRLDFGPGYRVYYSIMQAELILLALGGGDKSTQSADIKRARAMLPNATAGVKKALEEERRREYAAQTGR